MEGEADEQTEKPTVEIGTMKNQNQNKVEEEKNIKSSSQGTGLSCHTGEETQEEKHRTEGETNNSLTQGKGDIEKESVNAGTGSPCMKENRRQQHDVQTGGKTMNELDNRDEDTNSVSEESQTPGPAETETHTEQPENNVDSKDGEERATLNNSSRGKVKSDLDEGNEKEEIEPINNKPAGQHQTEEKQQNDLPAGEKTENKLDHTKGQTGDMLIGKDTPCPAEKEGQQDKNRDRRDGGENPAPIKENTRLRSPVDGQKDVPSDLVAQSPVAEEGQQDELQAGGERKTEEETNLLSEETKPPSSPKTETPTEQQNEEGREEIIKGLPDEQVEGDGEEGTTSTNNKTGHQAEVSKDKEKEPHVPGTDTQNDGQREE